MDVTNINFTDFYLLVLFGMLIFYIQYWGERLEERIDELEKNNPPKEDNPNLPEFRNPPLPPDKEDKSNRDSGDVSNGWGF